MAHNDQDPTAINRQFIQEQYLLLMVYRILVFCWADCSSTAPWPKLREFHSAWFCVEFFRQNCDTGLQYVRVQVRCEFFRRNQQQLARRCTISSKVPPRLAIKLRCPEP
jgi:hypothetical protein